MNETLRRNIPIGMVAVAAVAVWACVLAGSLGATGKPIDGVALTPLVWVVKFGIPEVIALAILMIGAGTALVRPGADAARAVMWLCTGLGLLIALRNDHLLTRLFPAETAYIAVWLFAAGSIAVGQTLPEVTPALARRPGLLAAPYVGVAGGVLLMGSVFAVFGNTPRAGAIATSITGAVAVAALVTMGTLNLRRARRVVELRMASELRRLVLTTAVAFVPTAIALFASAGLGLALPAGLVDLGLALWLLMPLALANTILGPGLFDPRTLLKQSAVYVALTVFLVGGFFATVASLRTLVASVLGHGQTSDWESALATAIIAVAFVPVRDTVSAVVDRLLFRTRYDFREVVARVTIKSHTTLDINEMKLQFMIAIDEALRPQYLYILTRLPEAGVLATVGLQSTWGDTPTLELRVSADDPLLTRHTWEREVEYVPATGLTGLLSPLAALGPHYRVPLQVGDEVVGLVILGPKRSDESYTAEDRELLAATRLPLAAALKTAAMLDDRLFKDRMDQELKRAREVQEAMLPSSLPVIPGYDFAASSVPCYEASGDYYDFLPLADERLGIVVADVAGKGIAAALAMAMTKSGLHNQVQTDANVVPVLTALNKLLHGISQKSAAKSFTTCLYAVLDPGGSRLTYACAGHPPPHHFNARTGQFTPFPLLGGFPLGVRASAIYPARDVALAPGDVLVFYTDGVTEAQAPDDLPPYGDPAPGEPFETDRLSDVIRSHHRGPAREIHDAIKRAVAEFSGGRPASDDITLVVIKAVPPRAAAPTADLSPKESK